MPETVLMEITQLVLRVELLPTGGFAGVSGSTSSADGTDNTNIGGGGAGAHAGGGTDRSGGNGGPGQVAISYTQLTYKSQLVYHESGVSKPGVQAKQEM